MIEYENKLPRMKMGDKDVGTYNNVELGFPSIMTTKDYKLGMFIKTLRDNIFTNRRLVFIDNKSLVCNINWIRDHVHIMKATRHWEHELSSFLNFIIDTQRDDGHFYELIKQYDDYAWKMVNEDCYIMYPDDNLALVRLELEADIEYLVVEGAMYLYKTTGDDEWLKKVLPRLEKAINYVTSDKKRWSKEHGLVIRPFTIDTWDFKYDCSVFDRKIEDDTAMSIMHGDNSGVYQAMNQLAWFNRRLGNEEKAVEWENRAEELKDNMFKHLWNGKFFMHQLHINHCGADNLENERLSLSNTYDMNRGVTSIEQSRKIIEEYMARREKSGYSAEWFSIDPPYEQFAIHGPGSYVNGAISPFTAGELSKAALNNGYEEYGWNIIKKFIELAERDGTVHFLYCKDLSPQPEGGPSAWGAAAFISAVDEGLAGICDMGINYDEILFSPKFPVTDYDELRYVTGYEVSGAKVDVRYILKDNGMRYDITSPAKKIKAHILLPKEKTCSKLLINSIEDNYDIVNVGSSQYIDFDIFGNNEKVSIEILF